MNRRHLARRPYHSSALLEATSALLCCVHLMTSAQISKTTMFTAFTVFTLRTAASPMP